MLATRTDDVESRPDSARASTHASAAQRPLAIMVIGDLLTTTVLTLFVLLAICSWVLRRRASATLRPAPDTSS
jgi:cobalt-zinc-cadmium resistance protein CzcA